LSIKNHHFNETLRDVQTMGACLSIEREEGKARKRSEEIDRQLGELAKQQNNVIKILLLGKWLHCTPQNSQNTKICEFQAPARAARALWSNR
jgi:hypothetical protein